MCFQLYPISFILLLVLYSVVSVGIAFCVGKTPLRISNPTNNNNGVEGMPQLANALDQPMQNQ